MLHKKNEILRSLSHRIKTSTKIVSLNSGVEVIAMNANHDVIVQRFRFFLSRTGLNNFVEGLGSYSCDLAHDLPVTEVREVYVTFSNLILELVHEVDSLLVLRDEINAPLTHCNPPVLLTQLRDFTQRKFHIIMKKKRDRLLETN